RFWFGEIDEAPGAVAPRASPGGLRAPPRHALRAHPAPRSPVHSTAPGWRGARASRACLGIPVDHPPRRGGGGWAAGNAATLPLELRAVHYVTAASSASSAARHASRSSSTLSSIDIAPVGYTTQISRPSRASP